jgi:hypothetical protein
MSWRDIFAGFQKNIIGMQEIQNWGKEAWGSESLSCTCLNCPGWRGKELPLILQSRNNYLIDLKVPYPFINLEELKIEINAVLR